jgi:hypothetical protein
MLSVPALLPTVVTMNEPVTTPPETEQVELRIVWLVAGSVIVQDASPELNPEPETFIVLPPLPLVGETDTLNALTPTENGAVANGLPLLSVTVTI